uniref:Reverse transcriptase zinc-binding domain-containing protein n=1 Tax=Ananas comosus var. bracteatus TaxID=296719 RepID=A0A6V7NRY1_ANACO|nr:unnamed protein product [Ananas comosus var. bracteatus]
MEFGRTLYSNVNLFRAVRWGTRDACDSKIWRIRIPLKVKVFYWLVLRKRHLTADSLLKRGWIGNTSCVLCGMEEETMDHLFARCVFFRFLMVMALENVQTRDLGDDVTIVWDRWISRRDSPSPLSGPTGLIACWWIIWEARNGTIFRSVNPDPLLGIHKIKLLTNQWKYYLSLNLHHCNR